MRLSLLDIVQYNEVYIFGAVENQIVEFILEKGLKIVAFIDNDKNKWSSTIREIPIKSVESLCDNKDESIVIISTYKHWDEMETQMAQYNVNCVVAYRDIRDFCGAEFQAFCNKIDVNKLVIDTLHIELSSLCNCRCIYCPFHGVSSIKSDKGLISWDTVRKIVDTMRTVKTLKTLDVVGNGEIFIHKEWDKIINYVIGELKITNLVLYTNGMLLNDENIKKLSRINAEDIRLEISIDGRCPSDNDKYRIGSVYEKVKKNVLDAYKMFEDDSHINMVITNCYPARDNELQEGDIIESYGAKIPRFLQEDFPDVSKVSKYTLAIDNFRDIPGLNKKKKNWGEKSLKCLDIFHRIAFDYQGNMVRCSCWKSSIDIVSNIYSDDVLADWLTESGLNNARKNTLLSLDGRDSCHGCPLRGIGDIYFLMEDVM
jgi:MoaA/NifB/PqqE/SkfB family radical SAM enzyme